MSLFMDVHEDAQVVEAVRRLALEDYTGPGKPEHAPRQEYEWLRNEGSRIWLDTGDAAAAQAAWGPEVEALTTNNTLVNSVVQTGVMDGLVSFAARRIRQARPEVSEEDLVIEIAFLINAKLALSLVQKFGARVSVELHPATAHDVRRTLNFARRYYNINREFFYIKVPLTADGFVAVRKLSGEGIPVNFTLGFSARQNYLAAQFSRPKFVNVFLGRLNSLVEENGVGQPANVGEKAALASFEALCAARKLDPDVRTEQIAASLRGPDQVSAVAGMHVLTIPPKVAGQYLESGVTRDQLRPRCSSELPVEIDAGAAARFDDLWTVSEQFMDFVDEVLEQGDRIADGPALIQIAREHSVNLFAQWTEEDRTRLRDGGKIPKLSEWPNIALDDLMSVAALESFVVDQNALDERILRLVRES